MLSISKSMRAAIWDYSYKITSRLVSKDRNKWFIITPTLCTKTPEETRRLAFELFNTIQVASIQADYEDIGGSASMKTDEQVAQEI